MSIERLSSAVQSGNLSWGIETRDIDYLTAMGAVAINEPLTAIVARILAGDAQSYRTAMHAILAKHAKKRTVTAAMKREVDDAMWWWLRPECRPCSGIGHMQIEDTPHLHKEACTTCLGSKLTPHLHMTEAYKLTLQWLDTAKSSIGSRVSEKIA